MNKIQWWGGGILIVVVALSIALTVHGNNQERREEAMRTDYMSGCTNKAPYAFCDCSYSYMRNKLGVEGFSNLALNYTQDHQVNPVIGEAISSCINK